MNVHTLTPCIGCFDKETYLKTIEEIRKCPPNSEMRFPICSWGGTSCLAFSFYDLIVNSNLNVTTVGTGEISSAAIIVFLAGKKRLLTPHTYMFFHENGFDYKDVRLDLTEMKARYLLLQNEEKSYVNIICRRSGNKIRPRQVREMLRNEVVITAKDAVKLGLAHGIIR